MFRERRLAAASDEGALNIHPTALYIPVEVISFTLFFLHRARCSSGVITSSLGAAMNLGHDRICTRHLLVGLLQNEPSVAATIPGQQGVNPQSLHDIDAVLGEG
jgi:hypothetical protein